ncbi:hypothetical protein AABB24_025944, partial [Solanum stoloniferum]
PSLQDCRPSLYSFSRSGETQQLQPAAWRGEQPAKVPWQAASLLPLFLLLSGQQEPAGSGENNQQPARLHRPSSSPPASSSTRENRPPATREAVAPSPTPFLFSFYPFFAGFGQQQAPTIVVSANNEIPGEATDENQQLARTASEPPSLIIAPKQRQQLPNPAAPNQ